jgi:hypothetical protein
MNEHKDRNYARTRIVCSLRYDIEIHANMVVIKGQYRVTIFFQFQLIITTIMCLAIKHLHLNEHLKISYRSVSEKINL